VIIALHILYSLLSSSTNIRYSFPFLSFPSIHAVESSPREMHNLGIATIWKKKTPPATYPIAHSHSYTYTNPSKHSTQSLFPALPIPHPFPTPPTPYPRGVAPPSPRPFNRFGNTTPKAQTPIPTAPTPIPSNTYTNVLRKKCPPRPAHSTFPFSFGKDGVGNHRTLSCSGNGSPITNFFVSAAGPVVWLNGLVLYAAPLSMTPES
jgi:hypothetical protein